MYVFLVVIVSTLRYDQILHDNNLNSFPDNFDSLLN